MSKKQEQEQASPEVVEVAKDVLRMQLPIEMPGLGHVNMYCLVDDEGAAVVDPGLPGPDNWQAVGERLAQAGIEPSVGSVGDSYDNALAETIIGLFKTEVIRPRGPWRSLEAVEFATLEWVDWFNNRRLLESIGNVPPAELEAAYYSQREESAMAA